MRTILLKIAYDGTAYHGFQRQSNAVTVQSRIEDAIAAVTGAFSPVTGCSRTDTGVHAQEFFLTFETGSRMPAERFAPALVTHLPEDITVWRSAEAQEGFHPRYSAIEKEYTYTIWNAPQRNPFLRGRALHYKYPLDACALHRAAQYFVGTHDFCGFMSAGSAVKSTVRTVRSCVVEREGDCVRLRIAGDGFLYNMVRIIAGTLLYVAEGKIPAERLPEIIASGDRTLAGPTAPAEGLCLTRVSYGEEWPCANQK